MNAQIQAAVQTAQENAPAITYTGGGSAIVLWGLHISDIGVIVSAVATLVGVFLQMYVTIHKIKMLERDQKESNRLATIAAVTAVAQGVKSADNSARITATEEKMDQVQKAIADPLTPAPPQA